MATKTSSLWDQLMYGKADSGDIYTDDSCLGLVEISADRLGRDCPYIHLIIATLVQAGKDKKQDFIYSGVFDIYCWIAMLEPKFVRRGFELIWNSK